jgi:hypothetical protein
MTYRLAQNDVNEFIQKIKEFKQENVEIPEKFQMGQEVFTERDMNQLIGSFYVVIPVVSFYSVERDKDGDFDAIIKVSFTVVDVQEVKAFAQFFVETTGASSDSGERAAQIAIGKIPTTLEFEVRSIPEFTLKSAVLERIGGDVVMAMGRDMGILTGYEFSVLSARILDSGRLFESETGLLVVKDVGEEVSMATILYGSPEEGDQLKEIPRIGFELIPYFNILLNPWEKEWKYYYVAGIRASVTKRFYTFRPIAGIEVPLPLGPEDTLLPFLWIAGFPFTFYIGGEATFYMGRIQITPQAAVGASFLIPWWVELDEPVTTHIGGFVNVNLSYLITRDVKISLDAGYKHWISIWDPILEYITDRTASYGGFMLGAAVALKL